MFFGATAAMASFNDSFIFVSNEWLQYNIYSTFTNLSKTHLTCSNVWGSRTLSLRLFASEKRQILWHCIFIIAPCSITIFRPPYALPSCKPVDSLRMAWTRTRAIEQVPMILLQLLQCAVFMMKNGCDNIGYSSRSLITHKLAAKCNYNATVIF